jgi:dCTP deaminase
MSILTDKEIKQYVDDGVIGVDPVDLDEQLQPASLDIRLGNEFRSYSPHSKFEDEAVSTNSKIAEQMRHEHCPDGHMQHIKPGEFYLANTKESFVFPDFIAGRLTGRSSIGRMGLTIHQTAGLFDPGFEGEAVLEMKNVTDKTIKLEPGTKVGQMVFEKLNGFVAEPYNSEENHYQGQEGAVPSKINE